MVAPGIDAALLPAVPLVIGLAISGLLGVLPGQLARGSRFVGLAAIAAAFGVTIELWQQGRLVPLQLSLYGSILSPISAGPDLANWPAAVPLSLVALFLVGLVALDRRPPAANRGVPVGVVGLLLAEFLAVLLIIGADLPTVALIWMVLVAVGGALAASEGADALDRLRPWLGLALVGAPALACAAFVGPTGGAAILVLVGGMAAGLGPFGAWLWRVPPESAAMAVADGFLPLAGLAFAARGVALAPGQPGLIELLLLLGLGNVVVAARAAGTDDPTSFLRAAGRADAALAFLGLAVGTPQVVAASFLVVAVGALGRALARSPGGWPRWLGWVSLAGFPTLAGFAGRWLFLDALVAAGRPAPALLALLATGLVVYGVFRGAIACARADRQGGEGKASRASPGSWLAVAVLVALGLAPGGWLGGAFAVLAGAGAAGGAPALVTVAMFLALLPLLAAASPRRPLVVQRRRNARPESEVLWDAIGRLAEHAAVPARAIEERYSLAFGLLVAVAALYAFGG